MKLSAIRVLLLAAELLVFLREQYGFTPAARR